MKRCFIFLLASALSVTLGTANCATIGNSIEPIGKGKKAISWEQNLIFSREIDYGQFVQADMKDAYQWYGKFGYGAHDLINIYAKAGTSDLEHKFRVAGGDFDIEYDLGPLWGVGALTATPRWHGFNVGADLQYVGWYVGLESLKFNRGRAAQKVGEVLVTEFQGTAFISYEFKATKGNGRFIPYAGLSYVYFNNETKETIEYTTPARTGTMDFDLDNSRELLFAVGGDFAAGEHVHITLEGTLQYDNRGVMCAMSYKF